MCGIVSYIGKKAAKDTLLEGLRSLEYRGYDSSGIALLNDDLSIDLQKTQGKIVGLEKLLVDDRFGSSSCGIGHTRWATHGEANTPNAHPHQDEDGDIALVHNGIIKNYLELKKQLQAEGTIFSTETDSEVIAKLFSKYRKQLAQEQEAESQEQIDRAALRATIKQLDGSYAISILTKNKRRILVAKNESPLVIGIGDGENFVASDSATVLQFTDKILKLKDKQIAELDENSVHVEDIEGASVKAEVLQLVQTSSVLEKGAYKHFLLKEIHEQPSVISKMLQDYESPESKLKSLNIQAKALSRVIFVACGSAYHASLVGKHLIEEWAGIPVEAQLASEFLDGPTLYDETCLVIGISQSGETADTLGAIRKAKRHGAQVLAITNKDDSAIVEETTPNFYVTPAGNEVSVASTKAFSSQVLTMYLLALEFARARDSLSTKAISQHEHELHALPQILDQIIERDDQFRDAFTKYAEYKAFLFLSRGINYPIALEGALKLKELSYIHATGYASGEMKHGPIAILDQHVPVLSIAISGNSEREQEIYRKTLLNAEEARARKSPSLVLACDSNHEVDEIFDEVIRIPDISQLYSPIVANIPLQFLAYYIAEELGKDVDQPRNLAKSVTVE